MRGNQVQIFAVAVSSIALIVAVNTAITTLTPRQPGLAVGHNHAPSTRIHISPLKPVWQYTITRPGVTVCEKGLNVIQLVDGSGWVGSFWGKDSSGERVRIFPASSSDGDTLARMVLGSIIAVEGTKIEYICTQSVGGAVAFHGSPEVGNE